MRAARLLVALGCVATLAPAAAPCDDEDALGPVSYQGTVSVTSQRTASVELVTGDVNRHRTDEQVLPHWLTKGSWASRHPSSVGTFDAADEAQFVQALVVQLVHLRLFKQAAETSADNSDDVHVRLTFAATDYFEPAVTHASAYYLLHVDMQIGNPQGSVSKSYVGDSRHARSADTGDASGLAREKTRAAIDLMNQLIPDVEAYLQQKP
jgi:hypothetical protein